MNEVTELFHLDTESFREWTMAERKRLPGSTSGFARFLALVRMTRPNMVVWLSDGTEPTTCGYEAVHIARFIADMLPSGSQLLWVKVGEGSINLPLQEIAGFSIVCAPASFEVVLSDGRLILQGAHVERVGEDWRFMRVTTIDVETKRSASTGASVSGTEVSGEITGGSSDESVSESEGPGRSRGRRKR